MNTLNVDRQMNYGPGISIDLRRLGGVANCRGERERACDYWGQSLSIYEQLAVVDHRNWFQWERNAIELRNFIQEHGCPKPKSSGMGS